jgi:hypothetical protein
LSARRSAESPSLPGWIRIGIRSLHGPFTQGSEERDRHRDVSGGVGGGPARVGAATGRYAPIARLRAGCARAQPAAPRHGPPHARRRPAQPHLVVGLRRQRERDRRGGVGQHARVPAGAALQFGPARDPGGSVVPRPPGTLGAARAPRDRDLAAVTRLGGLRSHRRGGHAPGGSPVQRDARASRPLQRAGDRRGGQWPHPMARQRPLRLLDPAAVRARGPRRRLLEFQPAAGRLHGEGERIAAAPTCSRPTTWRPPTCVEVWACPCA